MRIQLRGAVPLCCAAWPQKADMLPETRRLLGAFYAPFNERLAQALGDHRFAWPAAA